MVFHVKKICSILHIASAVCSCPAFISCCPTDGLARAGMSPIPTCLADHEHFTKIHSAFHTHFLLCQTFDLSLLLPIPFFSPHFFMLLVLNFFFSVSLILLLASVQQ